MSQILLMEGLQGGVPFIVDRESNGLIKGLITEDIGNGRILTHIPGTLSLSDIKNGNNRRYPKRVWEKNLQSGSILQNSIQERSAWGSLEHPANGKIDLNSPLCIVVTEALLVPTGLVHGKITVLNTPEGSKLRALIEAGWNPKVSSRGYGSLLRAADGVDDVQDDYICEGWDVVGRPSFLQAQLNPLAGKQESTETCWVGRVQENFKDEADFAIFTATFPLTTKVHECWESNPTIFWTIEPKFSARLVESDLGPLITATSTNFKTIFVKHASNLTEGAEPLPVVVPPVVKPQEPAAKPASEPQPQRRTMDLLTVRSTLETLRGRDIAKLAPQQFAEGFNSLTTLHREVAKYQSEHVSESWDCEQLHKEISLVEETWHAITRKPVAESLRLTEQNSGLRKVIKAVTEQGLAFKEHLAAQVKKSGRLQDLCETAISRGRAWMQKATTLGEANAKLVTENQSLDRRYDKSCKIIEEMIGIYHEDLTRVGKAYLQEKFKDALTAKPELAEKLKGAKRTVELAEIRETLEGKKPGAKLEEGAGKVVPPVIPAAAPIPPVAPAPVVGKSTAVPVMLGRGPLPVTESVEMIQRLSKSHQSAAS